MLRASAVFEVLALSTCFVVSLIAVVLSVILHPDMAAAVVSALVGVVASGAAIMPASLFFRQRQHEFRNEIFNLRRGLRQFDPTTWTGTPDDYIKYAHAWADVFENAGVNALTDLEFKTHFGDELKRGLICPSVYSWFEDKSTLVGNQFHDHTERALKRFRCGLYTSEHAAAVQGALQLRGTAAANLHSRARGMTITANAGAAPPLQGPGAAPSPQSAAPPATST